MKDRRRSTSRLSTPGWSAAYRRAIVDLPTPGGPLRWISRGWATSPTGGREAALEQRLGRVGPGAHQGQADLDHLGVVRRELGVAGHGLGLGVGEQGLPYGDGDVVGEL